ncbi:hypothetical protein EDD18DRAFT_1358327 [Armillaria luteobubalina]|uniref:Uncharacterized protein n=1 Tax=Armillaria luteobubalina TaxID=153913 RepID=A0AA39PWK4_9AGAR|nr:hypothetical protein EDD18DRAFT_1358327 [Armillaria luteobubalina]
MHGMIVKSFYGPRLVPEYRINIQMALLGWCTSDQNDWFDARLPAFHQARLKGKPGEFLVKAVKDFFAEFPIPECQDKVIGDEPEHIARRAVQNSFYQKQKEQIMQKFNNNHNKAQIAAVAASNPNKKAIASLKKKVLFSLKPWHCVRAVEIYSHCYYPTCMKPIIKAAIHKKEYLDAIDTAPAVLNRFLQDLAVQTGWWFTIIGRGPDPADNRNIRTGSFHIGRNEHGCHFEDEYTHFSVDANDTDATHHTSFDESVITPFGRFLKSLFPPEIRAKCTCNKVDLQALETVEDNDEQIPSPMMCEAALALPTPDPVSTPSPLVPALPLFVPTSKPVPVPPLFNSAIEQAAMPLPSVPASPSIDPAMFDEIDCQLFEHVDFGHAYVGMTLTDANHQDYDGLLGHPPCGEEEVTFPFTMPIAHEHADMDIDPFHGLDTTPFEEP